MSLMFPKPTRRRRTAAETGKDEEHLRLIRQCQCLACGAEPAEAAHLKYGDPLRGKPGPSLGKRPADKWVTPLCPNCHRLGKDCQHSGNERFWWEQHRIDPIDTAIKLYEASSRGRKAGLPEGIIVDTMRAIVRKARRRLME